MQRRAQFGISLNLGRRAQFGIPLEPQRGALPNAPLKEDEMGVTPRINKCSTRCAVGYRTCICFEYQSVPLLE